MIVEIKAPSPGESILEVEVGTWLVEDGDHVEKDQDIAEIESDKATLPLVASNAGKIKIMAKPGEQIAVGTILCTIDTSEQAPAGATKKQKAQQTVISEKKEIKTTLKDDIKAEKSVSTGSEKIKVSPVAQKIMHDHGLSVDDVLAGLRRISRQDVEAVLSGMPARTGRINEATTQPSRVEKRSRMSSLRRKLSERLVAVRNETAMLTTFNETDMSEVISLRKKYQEAFTRKHGVKLGLMSFFVRAVTDALLQFPGVNSRIEGDEIVTPEFCDIGIAVQSDKGLVVPVLRNTETLSFAEIERQILDFADKARVNRLSIAEMTGGTFTITNGGVFGSMLSTPIINPPQAAILGMHNIVDRPAAVNGKVEIRPVMYIALSYDHRIIDGKDAVRFLVTVKELVENPVRMIFRDADPEKILLDI
jgi:2-oxoglutarate dehydrogenase E2 component (dihydrolipoamide succinyltransferase)